MMGLMGLFGTEKKKYSTAEKEFVCSECDSVYDTKEEAEQCCADETTEETDNESTGYVAYSKDKTFAILDLYGMNQQTSYTIDFDNPEDSLAHIYLKKLEELSKAGYVLERTIDFGSDNSVYLELYKLKVKE